MPRKTANDVHSDLRVHEKMCEERWKTTFNRLDDIGDHLQRIESRVIAGGGTVIVFLLGLLATHIMG